jgi:hypothetical protein
VEQDRRVLEVGGVLLFRSDPVHAERDGIVTIDDDEPPYLEKHGVI